MRERLHNYELMVIVSPQRAAEEELTAVLNRLQSSITNLGGEIQNVDQSPPWGRRKFAYPIRKYAEGEPSRRPFTEGVYVLTHFALPTTQVSEFERVLKLNDAILRHILLLVEHKTTAAPSLSAVGADSTVDTDVEADEDEDTEDES